MKYLSFTLILIHASEKNGFPDVIILSSVLPYLEKPYETLENILKNNFDYIIIDRTPFMVDKSERIAIQNVPPYIYSASYPAWFFNRDKFLNYFSNKYKLLAEFDALAGIIRLDNASAIDKGFIFQRINL